jgi:hypothetical protein
MTARKILTLLVVVALPAVMVVAFCGPLQQKQQTSSSLREVELFASKSSSKKKKDYKWAASTSNKKQKDQNKWAGPDWVEQNLETTKTEDKKKKKKKAVDWVAEFFNKGGAEDLDEEEHAAVTQQRTTEPKKVYSNQDSDYLAEGKDAWIERDMKKAGMAQHDTDVDWVADDMTKVGRRGSNGLGQQEKDKWIQTDMRKAGQSGSPKPSKLPSTKSEKSKRFDAISKDMTKAGKQAGSSWVAADMKEAGAPNAHSTVSESSWMRQMDKAMDDKRRHPKIKDLKDGMTRAGSSGGENTLQTRRDMEKTGKAESPTNMWSNFMDELSHQLERLEKWQLKAFDTDKIAEDMTSAGRDEDQAWIGRDMKATGKNGRMKGQPLPTQEKELQEEMTTSEQTKWVSKDMREGGAAGPHSSHVNRMAKHQLESLVAEDLNKAGRGDTGYESIQHDMEEAGHAQSQASRVWGGDKSKEKENSMYKFELNAFQDTKHAKADMPKAEHKHTAWDTAVEEERVKKTETKASAQGLAARSFIGMPDESVVENKTADDEHSVEETSREHKENLHRAVHVLKKIVMPWKKWENF